MFQFFQYMIRFRKEHRILRTDLSGGCWGFPDYSFYGVDGPRYSFSDHDHYVGILFAGGERGVGPQLVYVASNAWWEELHIHLPELPASAGWSLAADTWDETPPTSLTPVGNWITIRPRSVMVFVGR